MLILKIAEVKSEEHGEIIPLHESIGSEALLCLWFVHQPSFPKFILSCRSPPLVASFSPGKPVVVLAGLDDGSLAVWDLRENNSSHHSVIKASDSSWNIRPPSFLTACCSEGVIEGSEIIALQTLSVSEDAEINNSSFQVRF